MLPVTLSTAIHILCVGVRDVMDHKGERSGCGCGCGCIARADEVLTTPFTALVTQTIGQNMPSGPPPGMPPQGMPQGMH